MIGLVNADMFGTPSEPGEYVDWSTYDVDTREGWEPTLGCSVEEYAEANPHMIVFEVEDVIEEWEQALLEPVEPDAYCGLCDGAHHPRQCPATADALRAEREASLAYAAEFGYDVDPVTGQYLPPEGE